MKSMQNNLPNLDELDLMLIRELEKDARASYATLASRLGTSPSTVNRRFNRLIERDVISITVKPYYAALGYETRIILAVNTFPWAVHSLARQLAAINSVKFVWATAGRYDILAMAMYQNLNEYLGAFAEDFGNLPADVKIETMLSVKIIKSSMDQIPSDGAAVTSRFRIKLGELDLAVIRELEKSPRIPVKDLAGNIGASIPTVRSCLRRITSQRVIRVITTPDPASAEDAIRGYTLVQFHPSILKNVTEALQSLSPVKYAALTVGAFNCAFMTSFQNSDQMTDFMTRDLGNMPGVVNYESLILLTSHKNPLTLLSDGRSSTKSPQ